MLRIMRFVDDDIDEDAACQFPVQPRGGEVHVARHILPGTNGSATAQVLCAAPLMRRDDVAVTVVLLHRRFETVKIATAGIRFIARHDGGPLTVAHGIGAAIGQQIDVHILPTEQKGVIPGFRQGALTLLAADDPQRLDHLDLPRFSPGAPAELLTHGLRNGVSHTLIASSCSYR